MLNQRRVLPDRLRILREDNGLTFRGLAEAMGQPGSAGYLCKIERSHIDAENVSARYIKRIADALGVSIDDISTRQPRDQAEDAA